MASLYDVLKEHGIDIDPIFNSDTVQRNKEQWLIAKRWTYQGKDFFSAIFGDWKRGSRGEWKSFEKLSTGEKEAAEKELKSALKSEARAREKEWQRVAEEEIHPLWAKASEVGSVPYLEQKQIPSLYGARLSDNGQHDKIILVPMQDTEGVLWNVQRIYSQKLSEGNKFFWPGGRVRGLFSRLRGPGEESDNHQPPVEIYLCEGYATACTIKEALSSGEVIAALSAGNLLPVAQELRAKYPDTKIIVCADNDAFKTTNKGLEEGQKTAEKIEGELRSPVFKIPTQGHTDFNDLKVAEGIEKVREQLTKSSEKKSSWLDEIHKEFAIVNMNGNVGVIRFKYNYELKQKTNEWMSFDAFKKLYANKYYTKRTGESGNIGTRWLSHPKRREYTDVIFAPGDTPPANILNTWQGFSVPSAQGDWSKLKSHIFEVICGGNDTYYQYLIKWLARMVQEPGRQGEVAIVLRGGRGTGKGMFADAIGRIFGPHYKALRNPEHLVGKFNNGLREAIFVFADEAFFVGNGSQMSALKGLITEPTLEIEPKGKNTFTARNYTHILMASNNEWVVPAGPDERRYFVLDVHDKHQQDMAYFGALRAALDQGEVSAMLFDLLAMDLSDFEVRVVPRTSALTDQKLSALGGVERWLFQCLASEKVGEEHWNGTGVKVLKDTAYKLYEEEARNRGDRFTVSYVSFCKRVHQILKVDEVRELLGTTRVRKFKLDGLSDSRKKMEQWIRVDAVDWDSGSSEAEGKETSRPGCNLDEMC